MIKAALSNSAGFNIGQRAEMGGLVYYGRIPPGGQEADVTLTMDQFRQDQSVYLHHEESKDEYGLGIEDGRSINARPDWTNIKEKYAVYPELQKLPPEQRAELQLKSLQAGKISSNPLTTGEFSGADGFLR